uniref:Zinc finger and BTB domain containing 4 n=1 Tax=Paramormyrops kingsleyae TaxID=1676925 RepID=A0A3B3RS60_9TELE
MVSRTEVWDPFHAGTLLSQLNEQRLAGPTPFCDITLIAANDTKFSAHKSVLAACSPYFQQLLSPSALTPPPPPHPVASLGKDRVLELPHLQPKVLSDLLDYIYTSRVSQHCAKGTKRLSEAGRSLGVPFLAGLVVGESNQMKSKSGLGKINGMEETDKADAAKSARTPHCFPLGRALSCRHCGKAFIHNKRLQSHEAVCRQAPPILPSDQGRVGPGRPVKKGRGFLGRHHRSFPRVDLLAEEDHFVKVVDGHIIYFCAVCERSYMTLSSLKRHSNVHSWRRKYPCRFCDKVFALAEYRTKHEVWHTGERRYQCIFCWEAFATYYNLKTHQKALHGISPGLISSEKTANGGYKQKANALKLYRLLPMRSQKRPYKTYSQTLADSLLLPPDSAMPLPLPLDCTAVSSVITYGHPKPSVIVHGTAVSSSVIVHSNQITSGVGTNFHNSSSPEPSNSQLSPKATHRPMKKHMLKEYIQAQRQGLWEEEGSATTENLGSTEAIDEEEKGRHSKGRKAHSKSITYMAKPACMAGVSEVRGVAPLCQITVRIGEEAIVKRRISETDLMRDKSPPPSTKSRKTDPKKNQKPPKSPSKDTEDNLWRPYYTYKPKRKTLHSDCGLSPTLTPTQVFPKVSCPSPIRQDRHEPMGHSPECGTCGRRFSTTRKRDKHELTHLLEFVCLLCRETFSSQARLEKHQRAQHIGSPGRVGRRPSVRHVCPHCSKVCKTAAALGRHAKLHESGTHLEASPSPRGGRASERPLLLQPPFSSRANDRPSAHALLLPRAPPPETKAEEDTSMGSHGEAGYPVQEFPLPLIVPGGCRSSKKHEDNILVSYPASPIPFGPLGKMVANGDLAKLPFYPDPYQLLYGPQLLPYPYSLAALPMALNMMAPGDKVEPLPFLPALLNYGANPYVGAVPTLPPPPPKHLLRCCACTRR